MPSPRYCSEKEIKVIEMKIVSEKKITEKEGYEAMLYLLKD